MNKIILDYMKKYSVRGALAIATVALICASVAIGQPAARPLKVVLGPRSTADRFEVTKHFAQSCPNIMITSNERDSDFMVVAGGWSGDYRFMVIKKGGDVLYITETALLSNSVKNVCKFLNTRT